jgi:flavorubredoxin
MIQEHALSAPMAPTEIAPGTHLIREVQHALGQPLSVYINSMVILGSEPIIVDTGSPRYRDAWIGAVFGLVEPSDVKWVFLSHEDSDHTGNLAQVMTACPNATLVCSWASVERYSNAYDFPLERCRWLNHGERLPAADREIVAWRPPMYDSPTTRGVLDTTSRVYWAADCFASPVPGGAGAAPLEDLRDFDRTEWWNGMMTFGLLGISPWLSLVDPTRYTASVNQLRHMDISTIASAHSPVITGVQVDDAFDMIEQMAKAEAPPAPDQTVLEHILTTVTAAATATD